MCMQYEMHCQCGAEHVSFHFQDNLMPPEVVNKAYCPACSTNLAFNPETMILDNGWALEYDMDIARFAAAKLPADVVSRLSPETLLVDGYASWRGIYPGDHIDSIKEKEEIVKLAKVDPRAYMQQMREWAIGRMARLKEEGWRKAHAA